MNLASSLEQSSLPRAGALTLGTLGMADSAADSQVLPQTPANEGAIVDRLEWLFDSLPLCPAPNTSEQRSHSQTDITPGPSQGASHHARVKPPPSHKLSHFNSVFVSQCLRSSVLVL